MRERVTSLVADPGVLRKVLAEAEAAHPNEACGLLLGEPAGDGGGWHIETALQAANVHSSPATHFEIDPQTLINAHRSARSGGPQIAGYYHSHPNGLSKPSRADAAMAAGDGMIWAIAAAGEITFWQNTEMDGDQSFIPLPYGSKAG